MTGRAVVLLAGLGFAWLSVRGTFTTTEYLLGMLLCSHALQRIEAKP